MYGRPWQQQDGRLTGSPKAPTDGQWQEGGLCGVLLIQTDDLLSGGVTEKYTKAINGSVAAGVQIR
eukprot:6469411-Amphidinium_carterae.2